MNKDVQIKIFVFRKDDAHWHIILQHEDGHEEISDQSFATREDCEAGIELLTRELQGKLQRVQ